LATALQLRTCGLPLPQEPSRTSQRGKYAGAGALLHRPDSISGEAGWRSTQLDGEGANGRVASGQCGRLLLGHVAVTSSPLMSAPSLAEKPSLRRDRAAKTLIISICALVAVYLVQAFSPLRLNVDVIAYLAKGAAIAEGTSDPFAGWELPPGYPYLIALLDAMGLGSSAVFVVVNVLAMVAGLLGVYGLLRHDLELGKWSAQIVCAMVLLSFVMVRHATLPMPELMFFGLATLTLWS